MLLGCGRLSRRFQRILLNLIGMGVLPLQFPAGASAQSLGLSGKEVFEVRA
jgi:aconitate hydratase